MTISEFFGNAFGWIKKAIQALWEFFKVVVKHAFRILKSFMRAIGDFIRGFLGDIRSAFKKVFVVRTKKSDLKDLIKKAKSEGKIGTVDTSTDELFGTDEQTEKTDYDYSIVVTDNDLNPVAIETISAVELDKKIGEKFKDEVNEIHIN